MEPDFIPPLTVALDREPGARGESIAQRTAELLGWALVDQEAVDYLSYHPSGQSGKKSLSSSAEAWVQCRLEELRATLLAGSRSELVAMARTTLEVAAQGETILLGKGAGLLLPREARLAVRIVAPLAERVGYIAQTERLPHAEAQARVRERDRSRRRYLLREFGRAGRIGLEDDLVLRGSEFGVEGCAELIAAAVREKEAFLLQRRRGLASASPVD